MNPRQTRQDIGFIIAILVTFVLITFSSTNSFAQAHVNESESKTVYVDAATGSDQNPGSQGQPVKTIRAGVSLAQQNNVDGHGTRVLIARGTYRELVNIHSRYNQTSAPMTFESTTPGGAVISAADVLSNWTRNRSNSGVYSAAWPYRHASCAVPSGWPPNFAPIALRTEMIFVNNSPLAQVDSAQDMRSGTFYVDESARRVIIWPSSGTDVGTALIEASAREETLDVQRMHNVVFRGLVFTRASSCINTSGARVSSSSNVLFDGVEATWNNWGGLSISSSVGFTVQNSTASHNGGVGFAGYQNKNADYTGNETDYNNWRGAMAALYDWGMGGIKLMLTHSGAVTNHSAYRNQAQGIWFDTDNKNVTVSNASLVGNVMGAIQMEASEGPLSVTGSRMCSNGAGVNVLNSAGLSVTNSVFYDNGGTNKYQGEFFVGGRSGGHVEVDWETGQPYKIYTSNTTLRGNVYVDKSPGQYVFSTYLGGNDWSEFKGTLASDHNQYYDPAVVDAFKTPRAKIVSLAGWQDLTLGDVTSTWAPDPSILNDCTVPSPSFPDFALNVDSRAYYTSRSGAAVVTLRLNSYQFGRVTLSHSSLPAGVSGVFSSQSLYSGIVTLSITASRSASRETVPVTIFASSGSRVHPVTVLVSIVPGA